MNTSLLSDRVWPVSGNGLARHAVLAIGAAYGARLGAVTLALYALEGAIGLPVFAEFKSGVMLASFGYILGFIAAAAVVGWLAQRGWDRSPVKMFAAMILGAAVVYLPGLAWLAAWLGSFHLAVQYGLTPFIAGDLVKAAIAALGFPAVWSLLARR